MECPQIAGLEKALKLPTYTIPLSCLEAMLSVATSLGRSAVVSRFRDTRGRAARACPGTNGSYVCHSGVPQSISRAGTLFRLPADSGGH